MNMANWDDILFTTRDWVVAAGRKVGDAAGVTKQKVKMLDNDHSIRIAMEALGQLTYDNRRNGKELDESFVEELLTKIDELKAANVQLQAEIDQFCKRKVCSCGVANASDAVYCKACAKPLDE